MMSTKVLGLAGAVGILLASDIRGRQSGSRRGSLQWYTKEQHKKRRSLQKIKRFSQRRNRR